MSIYIGRATNRAETLYLANKIICTFMKYEMQAEKEIKLMKFNN